MRIRAFLSLTAFLLVGVNASAGAPKPQAAELVGGVVLTQNGPGMGGFSGLKVDADGLGLLVLNDRGALFTGRITRDATGRITGARLGRGGALRGLDGRPLSRRRADSEGLAKGAGAQIFVSFEGISRVERRDAPSALPRILPPHPDFARFPPNGGFEALALDADGSLYAIPEKFHLPDGRIPVYRLAGERWEVARTLPVSPGFDPVEADIGPDGALYVLERRFRGVLGFSSQLRRFSPRGDDPGETLLVTGSGQHDNLEGLSVWRGPEGELRATMISDNNFFPAQRSEIVEYRLRSGVVSSGAAQ